MSHTLIILLVAVSSVTVTQPCIPICDSNCQWTTWSTVGGCSASCGYTGTRSRYRTETQLGTCSSSECSKSQTDSETCISPCVHGTATGSGCVCPATYTGRCCDIAVTTTPATVPMNGDWKCTTRAGTCQDSSSSCAGRYWSGFCAGSVSRRCCIPGSVEQDNKCIEAGGHCQSDSTCVGGQYKSGLCAGNANRKCCILDGQATPTDETPSDGTKLPEGKCSDLTIVTRNEWGARAGKPLSAITRNPPKILFIHHEGSGDICTNNCAQRVRDIQAAHLKKWSDIGYSYLVADDGRAYEGRGWGYSGAHTWGYNSIAVAICAIGNFEEEKPSQTILQTIANLIACAVDEGSLRQNYELFGHRDGGQTACPGKHLYDVIKISAHFSHRKIPRYNSSKKKCVENCSERKEI